MVVVTAEGDVLAPEADVFARKMDDGDRKSVYKNFGSMWYGFDKGIMEGTKEWDAREEAYGIIVEALKGLCSSYKGLEGLLNDLRVSLP